MNLHIISTGSKGNCYLLTDDQGRTIALDAGVGIKPILTALNHDISRFDGALITHEHQDHCKAANALEVLGIPAYMSSGTTQAMQDAGVPKGRYKLPMMTDGQYDVFSVGSWYVQPFGVQHDAAEPVGYLLANANGHRILYATDTFYIRYRFPGITHIIVECNYCTNVLMHNIESGRIGADRKKRLLHSHMSLENLLKWLKATDLTHCVKIVLVHLSDENSNEKKMVEEVYNQTGIETVAAEDGLEINLDLFPF